MPFKVNLPSTAVTISPHTSSILSAYQQALSEVFGKNFITEDDAKLAAEPSRDRAEWWCKFAAVLNKVVDVVNLKETKLLPFDVTIDVPAEELRQQYVSYLNSIIVLERSSIIPGASHPSYFTEKPAISGDDVDLLIYHILLRLITIALSDDMSPTRDGDALLKVIEKFIKKILEGRLLVFGKKEKDHRPFEKHLLANHARWVKTVTEMVGVLKELHANRTAINDVLDGLNALRAQLKRHIIVTLNPKQKPSSTFHLDWLDITLKECEGKWLALPPVSSSSAGAATEESALAISSSGYLAVEKKFKEEKDEETVKRLKRLYSLLERTNVLIVAMGRMDLLRIVAGWVPIMLGILKLDELAELLKKHSDNCAEALTIRDANDPIFDTPAARGLIRFTGGEVRHLSHAHADGLKSLMDPIRLGRIAGQMQESVAGLIEVEKSLGITLIDKSRLPGAERGSVSSTSSLLAIGVFPQKLSLKERFSQAMDYYHGNGQVKQDINKAVLLFEKILCEFEDENSAYNLAVIFSSGKLSTGVDYQRSFTYAMSAAAKDHVMACAFVARCYEKGVGGGSPDYPNALVWYTKATELGHQKSIDDKARVERLLTTSQNDRKAEPSA